jgi:hypothetical protein
MASPFRPQGVGRYNEIYLREHNRRDDLRVTHKEQNPLPAQPDPQHTADELLNRSRRLLPGYPTMEALRVQQFASNGLRQGREVRLVSISTPCAPLQDAWSHTSSTIIMSVETADDLVERLTIAIADARALMGEGNS